jgi:DNA-binding LacI/PurR family transcriptional regulator
MARLPRIAAPGTVAVIGIDDLVQAAILVPLTTMHIPMREIGATAIDLLRDGMLGLADPPRRIELVCPMMVRFDGPGAGGLERAQSLTSVDADMR